MADETPSPEPETKPRRRREGQRPTAAEKKQIQETFLEAFMQYGNLTMACKAADIKRWTIYDWRDTDEVFGKRYREAEEIVNDTIRQEIFRRAVEGVNKPMHFQGQLVQRKVVDENGKEHYEDVTVKDYSDTLLIFLAKSRMPEFRDRAQVDVHATIDIQNAANEADRRFARLVSAASSQPLLAEPDAS